MLLFQSSYSLYFVRKTLEIYLFIKNYNNIINKSNWKDFDDPRFFTFLIIQESNCPKKKEKSILPVFRTKS